MINDAFIDEVFAAVRRKAAGEKRYPLSTYRLQFGPSFRFADASRLVPYLHELGITHVYSSPCLKARPGSTHGYDITDHNALNPEIGSPEQYDLFVKRLREHGMGQIMDFVPNHMSIIDNAWWSDVLENGPGSPYAAFFDVDWFPIKPELRGKVLLPILDGHYGAVLSQGRILLSVKDGVFTVNCGDFKLPIDPKSKPAVLQLCLERLKGLLGEEHPDHVEMQSVVTACNNLPFREEKASGRVAERQREKEVIKRRLSELISRSPQVRAVVDEAVKDFNGTPGLGASFDRMHELLESQAYRLSYWQVASDEINYRRFFDINQLVALRQDNPSVFEQSHGLLRQLMREGSIDGLRIDHIDGLFDPAKYLAALQQAYLVQLCCREASVRLGNEQADLAVLGARFAERANHEFAKNKSAAGDRPLYLIVEKILQRNERLSQDWPVDGTTGYDFGASVNGLFVNRRHARRILRTYQQFTGARERFADIVCRCKDLIMRTALAAEVNVIAGQLNAVSEASRTYRDFTLNSLRDAIRETIACFPVYRTYIAESAGPPGPADKASITFAINRAKSRNPAVSSGLFEYLRDTLLLLWPPDMGDEGREGQRRFTMRFQQLTGPVMAKGTEDTAFYRYNLLSSLNEVGASPDRFGESVEEFHRENMSRTTAMPHSLTNTYTHDSKRSEDVRARINALSEMPAEWGAALTHWSALNRRNKTAVEGEPMPDRDTEYLIYETLLGTYPYPPQGMNRDEERAYAERIDAYMLKAVREAKVRTSWINPNLAYEKALSGFVHALLSRSPSNPFLADFRAFSGQIARCGMYNSLSQTVLKMFSPGVPDAYQGSELWDFRLVDPDNRTPVDYRRRRRILAALRKYCAGPGADQEALAGRLLKKMADGRIKLYTVWKGLNCRLNHAQVFGPSDYIPLETAGPRKANACAFARRKGDRAIVVVVPRLVAKLTDGGAFPPTGKKAWGNTRLLVARTLLNGTYRDIFTSATMKVDSGRGRAELPVADLLRAFPVAVLVHPADSD